MTEEPIEFGPDRAPGVQLIDPDDRPPESLVGVHRSVDERVSPQTRRRLGLIVGFGAAIVGTLIALDLLKSLAPSIGLGAWIGLFLANWIGNGGLLVPIPGLRLVGWTMVVHQGADGPTLLVGLVAGVAMALGQTSFYLTAAGGSAHLHGSKDSDPSGQIADVMRRAKERTEDFVQRHGFPTIFTLSLLPNPLTTFASITAGSLGMGFRGFLVANFLGHVTLGFILAMSGVWLANN
jgi:membrane protein DedA with SNARE-associated domain